MKEGKRERVQGHGLLEINFSSFARCSRRVFLCVFGLLVNEGCGVCVRCPWLPPLTLPGTKWPKPGFYPNG